MSKDEKSENESADATEVPDSSMHGRLERIEKFLGETQRRSVFEELEKHDARITKLEKAATEAIVPHVPDEVA